MASQAQISLRFSRSATAASSVKVSVCDAAGKPIDGATASLTSSHAFKATGNAVTAAMLCPNVNGNTSPTITLTFKIDGLPDVLPTPHYALLDIHALNASGSYQSNNDGKARQFNVEINGGAKAASSEIKGQLTNVDIAAGIGDETGVHQEWSLPLSATCQLGNSLYLRLTVTAGKSNLGCFFGLTSVSLAEKMPEPEFRPFEASDEIGSPKMIYSLLTPKGQALAMNAEGTLALEPRTDAPSQTWYFVGKNALAGGYLLINAQGNRSYVVSGNEAARWVAIAILQGWGYYVLMKNYGILTGSGVWVALVIIISFIAGSSFVMWMGEQITEFGIGNGISIILFAGILSRVPSMVGSMGSSLRSGTMTWWMAVLVVLGILALIVLITWVNGAERRIPVQYAKRQVGRKMYGGQASTLPMKVNMSGVLPIIFAQSIAMIIPTVAAFLPAPEKGTFTYSLVNAVDSKSVLYMIVYFLMIIAFSYFYATIQFNPIEISNNLKKNGGFIPGFRPGKPTADFIKKVLNKVTLFGAIYLGVVAILPLLIGKIVNVAALSIGGTSVIIVVGVALETVQALESQMLMRQYKGFLE